MSLFPAYRQVSSDVKSKEDSPREAENTRSENRDWLNLKSFRDAAASNDHPRRESSPSTKRRSVPKRRRSRPRSTSSSSTSSSSSSSRSRSRERDRRRNRRSRSRSRDRRSKTRRTRSRSRGRRSRSRSRGRRSRSRSRNRRYRSRSRSRSRSRGRRRRSRSRSTDRRRKRRRREEADDSIPSGMPTRDQLIALSKHSGNKTFLEEVGIGPAFAFRTDSKPDSASFKEGKLPSQKIAHYKCRYAEALNGVKFNDPGRKVKKKEKAQARFFQKSYMKRFLELERVRDMSAQLKKKLNLPPPGCSGSNFIAIRGAEKEPGDDEANPLKVYDMATARYVSGRGGLRQLENEADEESAASFKLHEVQEKTREYNERLRQDPGDIQLWLEYVEFQDISIGDTEFAEKQSSNSTSSKKERVGKNVVLRQKALVEKKLAILKTAMEKNPSSVELGVKRLELSREILDAKTLDRQWKELIFLFPRSFSVWKFYLRFVSSNFTTFTVSRVIKEYRNYFAKMKQMHALPDQPRETEDEINVATVNLCNFLARTGFRERAMAVWQAAVELNLFSPDLPGYYSLDDRLALLEQFWESASPRFGEQGAVGWAAAMKTKNVAGEEDEAVEGTVCTWEDDLIDRAGRLVRRNRLWLELEVGRERKDWRPWRSSEEAAVDPERAVPFDDVSPFLFQFAQPRQSLSLLLGFVRFLGITFIDEPYLPSSLSSETVSAQLGLNTSEGLPDSVDWKPTIDISVLRDIRPDLEDAEYQTFCRNVLSRAVSALSEPYRTQMTAIWMNFELDQFNLLDLEEGKQRKSKKKELKNVVKNLLENDRDNVNVYLEYARLEHKIDGAGAAWKVLEPILSSHSAGSHPSLYVTAVSVCLAEIENSAEPASEWTDRAIWLLCLASSEGKYDASQVPKSKADLLSRVEEAKTNALGRLHGCMVSKKFITAQEDDAFRSSPVFFKSAYLFQAFIAAWLTYFVDGEREAVKLVELVLPVKSSRGAVQLLRENLFKISLDLARLSANAAWKRAVLKTALSAYPNNEYFLQKLIDYRVQPNVVDATWRSFSTQLLEKIMPSPLPQLYAVKLLVAGFVQHRRDEGSLPIALSFLNRARSLLERFVSFGNTGRHSPSLWRLLMWTTNSIGALQTMGDVKEDKASVNTIFYRSLQDCPAVKSLFLDVVGYLHLDTVAAAADDGLRRVLDILTEKEARTRMPIEELEVLLEREDDEADVEDDDEDI